MDCFQLFLNNGLYKLGIFNDVTATDDLSTRPLSSPLCDSQQRAADGSAGLNTEEWHLDNRSLTQRPTCQAKPNLWCFIDPA